jgi:hypothetical protein
VYPNTNFAGRYEISDSGIRDLLRLGEARQHGGKGDGEKKDSHLCLPGSGLAPASERGSLVEPRIRVSGFMEYPVEDAPITPP